MSQSRKSDTAIVHIFIVWLETIAVEANVDVCEGVEVLDQRIDNGVEMVLLHFISDILDQTVGEGNNPFVHDVGWLVSVEVELFLGFL